MYDIYKELNKIIDYIEENILEEIDINYLSRMSGLNINMLKNIFTCLAGISISEYIRYRRLSLATHDILNGEAITDVALKYHYSSLSSFTRSYKNFSDIAPKDIKNSHNLKMFNRIVFRESISDYNLEYKIQSVEFNLYGVSKRIPLEQSYKYAKTFWEEVKRTIPEFNEKTRYGFLYCDEEFAEYYCLLDAPFVNSIKRHIPKQKYFIYTIPNESSRFISSSIRKGISEYIKSLNYTYVDMPTMEIYRDNEVEIYIPIA